MYYADIERIMDEIVLEVNEKLANTTSRTKRTRLKGMLLFIDKIKPVCDENIDKSISDADSPFIDFLNVVSDQIDARLEEELTRTMKLKYQGMNYCAYYLELIIIWEMFAKDNGIRRPPMH